MVHSLRQQLKLLAPLHYGLKRAKVTDTVNAVSVMRPLSFEGGWLAHLVENGGAGLSQSGTSRYRIDHNSCAD
jgi:hypothetical protein